MSDLCSVAGCALSVQARGWCATHYTRWRTKGSPGSAERRRYATAGCAIEGCDCPHYLNGMCRPHDRAVKTHGIPTPRRRGEVVDGKRICPSCEVDRPLAEWGASSWCKPCCSARALQYVIPVTTWPATCEVCAAEFDATMRRRFCCSTACTRKRNNRENSKHVLRRRAAQRGTAAEAIRPRDIFERDDWTCGICREPVDPALAAPHPKSPSVDHVIPLSRGGTHTRDNVQTAHLGCNCRKGARLIEEVV